ncbi:MAG: hypothetical protein FJ284_12265 [Planctomycetes bacterium]|nr:hypothetical protein [Planctomycetota bacterium]
MLTFMQYVEGVPAPDRAPRPWLSRINPTPFTNARRKRIARKKTGKIDWFRPTVREAVPRHLIPRIG